jgi:hypothetical protein
VPVEVTTSTHSRRISPLKGFIGARGVAVSRRVRPFRLTHFLVMDRRGYGDFGTVSLGGSGIS